jgi:transcription elongation factor Elf1
MTAKKKIPIVDENTEEVLGYVDAWNDKDWYFDIGGKYYVYSHAVSNKEVFDINDLKHIEVERIAYFKSPERNENELNLKCPYCGKEDTDSWEINDTLGEWDTYECGYCGLEMEMKTETVRYFAARPKADINEKVEFKKVEEKPFLAKQMGKWQNDDSIVRKVVDVEEVDCE